MSNLKVGLKNIFLAFLKMGTFAFGGVYSMLAFFERELVHRKKWLSHEDFAEGVVIGQLTPGAPIINTGLFIGYKLRGLKGAIASVIGQVLPSFIIVLALAYLYIKYKDISFMRSVLKGVGAAVVGLIASVVYGMGKKFFKDYKSISFAVIAFICLAVFKFNPIFLIIAAGVGGLIVYGRGDSDGIS